MNYFILLLAIHFIADFPFQGEWLANNKGKSWEVMAYHCLIYTASFILFASVYSPAVIVLILLSHFVIDNLKARWGVVRHIWFDQILHGVILALVAVMK